MDISGEIANNHMKTDAKNLVNTARTSHLPEQKETVHMISMLRKEACSGNIHYVAQPNIAGQIASRGLQQKRAI